jgi:hypothetical protein
VRLGKLCVPVLVLVTMDVRADRQRVLCDLRLGGDESAASISAASRPDQLVGDTPWPDGSRLIERAVDTGQNDARRATTLAVRLRCASECSCCHSSSVTVTVALGRPVRMCPRPKNHATVAENVSHVFLLQDTSRTASPRPWRHNCQVHAEPGLPIWSNACRVA